MRAKSGNGARAALGLAVGLALGISPVRAQQPAAPAVAPAQDCAEATSNVEMTACAAGVLKKAEAKLAEAVRLALVQIDQSGHLTVHQRRDWKRAMRETQRHWFAYRKKDCGEVSGWEWHGGTGRALAGLTCEIAKVRARFAEIEERYLRR